MRLFIAIPSSEYIRKKLVAIQNKLKQRVENFRWSSPETFHLTLKYIGEVDINDVAPICKVTEQIVRENRAGILSLKSLGSFGSPMNPRIIWAGFNGDLQNLAKMADELDEAMEDFGIKPEHKKFNPHLTLGRAKRNSDGMAVKQVIAEHEGFYICDYEVDRVVVFESILQSGGAEHHPIRTINLK